VACLDDTGERPGLRHDPDRFAAEGWDPGNQITGVDAWAYPVANGAYSFSGGDGWWLTANGGSYVELRIQGRFQWFDPVGYHFTAAVCAHLNAGGGGWTWGCASW
jgi:hypothetical protein